MTHTFLFKGMYCSTTRAWSSETDRGRKREERSNWGKGDCMGAVSTRPMNGSSRETLVWPITVCVITPSANQTALYTRLSAKSHGSCLENQIGETLGFFLPWGQSNCLKDTKGFFTRCSPKEENYQKQKAKEKRNSTEELIQFGHVLLLLRWISTIWFLKCIILNQEW